MISSDGIVGRVLSSTEGFPFYGRSFLLDCQEYFSYNGMRGTHDGVMPPEGDPLRNQTAEYFRDMPPAIAPPMWTELWRATNNAWGPYVNDANVGTTTVDKMTPEQLEARRRLTIVSGRIMGMLAAVDGVVNKDALEAQPKAVAGFYRTMQRLFMGEAWPEIAPIEQNLDALHQLAAHALAGFVRSSFAADNKVASSRLVAADLGSFGAAVAEQLAARPNTAQPDQLRDQLVGVAGKLGRTMGIIVTHHTEFGQWRAANGGPQEHPSPGDALGEIGGYWRQSKHVPDAFRTGRLTYAAAIILGHGGPTKAARQEIAQVRDDNIADATKRGRAAMTGLPMQQDRFNMASRALLRAKEGVLARFGSNSQIEQSMSGYLARTAA